MMYTPYGQNTQGTTCYICTDIEQPPFNNHSEAHSLYFSCRLLAANVSSLNVHYLTLIQAVQSVSIWQLTYLRQLKQNNGYKITLDILFQGFIAVVLITLM